MSNVKIFSEGKLVSISCPVCSTEEWIILFKFGTALFPINISQCSYCGFIFQNPRVSEQGWNDYYETGIYDKFHRPRSVKGEKPVNDMGMITYNRVWGFISDSSDAQHSSSNYFNKIDSNIKICEVGAGHGDIITSFQGGQLFAIEPSENCLEILKQKGVTVLGKSINSINDNMNINFDIILMRHVLEHIYYPKKLLDDIIPLMSDNNILYAAVPNILTPNYLNSFTYPHISYFSTYSLAILCQSAGFEMCKIQEADDEIWCILKKKKNDKSKKKIKTSKEALQDSKNLLSKNIEETKCIFQFYNSYPRLLKRTTMRIISHIIPLALLMHIYDRRSKT